MSRFVKIIRKNQVHEQCGTLVAIDGLEIAIFKRDGHFYAINNICAHQHFSMLHQGTLDGLTVECPMHGWAYDLTTGKATTGQGNVARYAVKVEGEDVLVEVPDA